MGTKWVNQKDTNEKVIEGFDMFSSDYFQNVPRHLKLTGIGNVIKEIEKYFKQFGNPISNADKGLEAFIQRILVMMIGQVNCNTGALSNTSFLDKTQKSFTWATGQIGLLNADVVNPGIDYGYKQYNKAKAKTRYAYDVMKKGVKEGFSINEDPQLKMTIQSFMTTHPKITNMTALATLYITQLNKYEASIGANPTTDQLFIFNNDFDNQLNNDDTLNQIQTIASALPKPSYPNTDAGFHLFLKEKARFKFDTLTAHEYTFFPLNIEYFPYPTNLTGFEDIFNKIDDSNFIAELNSVLLVLNTPSAPPTPPPNQPPGAIDANYAFSVNLTATQKSPLISYLDYITQFFSFIVFKNQHSGTSGTISYPTVQANMFYIYTTYLNAVEFEKYRVYSTYLTPYEVAMFNHLFFICLNQSHSITNVYNIGISPIGDAEAMLTGGIPSPYINLFPQSVYQLISMFTTQINSRLPYLSGQIVTKNYQPLPMDGTLILPDSDSMDGLLLPEYILGVSEEDVEIPAVDLPPAIVSYYIPPGLAECDEANKNIQKECNHYAKKIKNELYRLFTIPIILYIVYNTYYLFFFKDCLSIPKETDKNGKNKYRHSCEKEPNGGGGTFTPIFPDWETVFHSLENHKTDFIFEFIFKPVKFFYTLFNAIKAFFRKTIEGAAIKDQVPYVFFLMTFYFIYRFIQKNGGGILKVLYDLMKLKTPDFKFSKEVTLKRIAEGVIIICFVFSFLNKFAGIRIFSDEEETLQEKGGDGSQESPPEERGTSNEEEENPQNEGQEEGGTQNEGQEERSKEEKNIRGGKAIDFSGLKEKFGNMKNKFTAFSEDKTWIKWLFIPAGALMTVIKWISAILYWVFKYIISVGLTTFSMFIAVLYFAWVFIFGASSYTTPNQTMGDKIDLINRVMYTKLCDNEKDSLFKYAVKSIFFFCIYFLIEGIIIHNLLKGMKEFKDMPKPNIPVKPNLSQKTNHSIESNNLAIKSFMIIVYSILISIVGLWSVYKFNYKMPDEIRGYKPSADDSINKTFVFDNTPDAYEEQSQNSVWKTLTRSDALNKNHIQEFKEKTAGMTAPSMVSGFISKMGEYSDKLNAGVNSMMSKANEFRTNFSFGSKDSTQQSKMSDVVKANFEYHTQNMKASLPSMSKMSSLFGKKTSTV